MSCDSCSNNKTGKPNGCKSNGYCTTSGCNKLDVFDWLSGVPLAAGQQVFDAVEVRFKNTRKNYYRTPPGIGVNPGDLVTVEASPGHDVGMVSLTGALVRLQMQRKGVGADTFELKKVLRKSTQEDIDKWHTSRKLEDDTMFASRKIVQNAKLDMKVSDVEYQGDGSKATFYYTSEERIDFRDLLRSMAQQFGVRIDMKQIGSRQEAGRIGGIGSCGRELCCSTWLTDFRSVTTSAARYQQLALNQSKLAGQCGKLKCCLNYELDMYLEAVKSYPSMNAKLKTQQGTGYHMKTDIFQGKMFYLIKNPGSTPAMIGLKVEKVREILEQNKQGVEPFVNLQQIDEAPKKKTEEKEHDYENVVGMDDLTRFDKQMKERRGGKKGKRGSGSGQRQSTGGQQKSAGGSGSGQQGRERSGQGQSAGGQQQNPLGGGQQQSAGGERREGGRGRGRNRRRGGGGGGNKGSGQPDGPSPAAS